MNQKTLTILFVATLVVGGVAALKLSRDDASVRSEAPGAELLPELKNSINNVASIKLERKDGSVTIVRQEKGWGMAEKNGYPVDAEAVKQTLLVLSDLKPLEQKTDDPARYEKLGVQEPGTEGSTSTLVTIQDKAGKELAKLIVGKQSEGKGGLPSGNTYVRRAGEKVSWLAKGNPALKEKSSEWLQKQIIEVKRDRLRSAEVRHADGEVVHVERAKPDDANFELSGIPEGQELSYPSAAGSITSALEYLNLEDVLPAEKVDFTQGAGPTSEFRTFDGLKVTVQTKEDGEKTYARFSVAYDAPPQVGPTPEAPAADPAKPPEPKPAAQKTPEEVQKEASELEARLSKWVYQIPAYNKAFFTKHMKDMLKAKTPPPAPAPAEGAPPAEGSTPPPPAEKPADEKPH